MSEEKYPYVKAKLRDCKGSLSARWYVEFQVWHYKLGALVKRREYCPAKFETEKERRRWAKTTISELDKLLEKGYVFAKDPEPVLTNEEIPFIATALVVLGKSTYLRPKSRGTYRTAINKASEYLPATLDIRDIRPLHAYQIRERFLEKNNPVTVNKTIEHVARVFDSVQKREGLKLENPFRIEKLPETDNSEANISFTDTDREALEKYLIENNYPLYIFTRFIYYAFIRPKELRSMKVKHVKDSYIVVPGEVSKNKKTETIPIIKPLKELINLQEVDPEYYLFGAGIVPAPGTCSENTPYNWHVDALKECGLGDKGYTLYSWKHTGAVNAYLSGVGIKELQKLLRHSKLEYTDIYLKSLGLRTDPNISDYNW